MARPGAGPRAADRHRRRAGVGDRGPGRTARRQQRVRESRRASRSCSSSSGRAPAQRGQPQLGAGQRAPVRVGPAVAGLLIAASATGVCFLLNAGSFVAVVVSLAGMDPQAAEPDAADAARARGQLREGLRYVRRTPRPGAAAGDDGARRLPDLRVPGLAAGDGQPRAARRRPRLRLHDRRDGHRRGGRRAGRGRPRAHRSAALDRRRRRVRPGHGGGRRGARAWRSSSSPWRLRGRQRRSRSCRPATRRSSSASEPTMRGPGDVAVVRRLPGLDADRRPGHRRGDGGVRCPGRACSSVPAPAWPSRCSAGWPSSACREPAAAREPAGILRRLPPALGGAAIWVGCPEDMLLVETRTLVQSYPAVPDSVPLARQELVEFALAAGADEHQAEDIKLSVSEALTNVVLHAYPGAGRRDPRPGGRGRRRAVGADRRRRRRDCARTTPAPGWGSGWPSSPRSSDGLTIVNRAARRHRGADALRARSGDAVRPAYERGSSFSANSPASPPFSTTT